MELGSARQEERRESPDPETSGTTFSTVSGLQGFSSLLTAGGLLESPRRTPALKTRFDYRTMAAGAPLSSVRRATETKGVPGGHLASYAKATSESEGEAEEEGEKSGVETTGRWTKDEHETFLKVRGKAAGAAMSQFLLNSSLSCSDVVC